MTRQRRVAAALGVIVLAMVIGAGWIRNRIAALDRDALRLAETGKRAITLLNQLRDALGAGDPAAVAALYAPQIVADRPSQWQVVASRERDGVRTIRWQGEEPAARPADELAESWLAWLGEADEVDLFKIKLGQVHPFVDPAAQEVGAEIYAVLWRRSQHGEVLRENRMRLRMRVGGPESGGLGTWTIRAQALDRGETVEGRGDAFAEVAVSAGVDFLPEHNPDFDTQAWAPERFAMIRYGSAGLAATDFDGDGWDDLFFANGGRPRLYRNRGDGTFDDVTTEAGLPDDLVGVNVGLFVDLDNDGDRDLFCGLFTRGNRLFRNDGSGTFTEVTASAGLGEGLVVVAAAGDYNGDGLIDLYLGRYLDPRVDLPTTLFYTRNGAANSLLKNLGDLRFEDVTTATGTGDVGLTLGVTFADYDRDGDQDLYVANDFGRNALLRNDGDADPASTTFTDVAGESDALDFGFGMSATWADLDNDRDMDLYVSNVHSGQRWYGQAATLQKYLLTSVRQGTMRQDFPLYREIFGYAGAAWHSLGDRMTKGNSLLVNESGHFTDVSEAAGANPFGWYWGAAAFDFDHDGWLDLYGANGWISGETYDDL